LAVTILRSKELLMEVLVHEKGAEEPAIVEVDEKLKVRELVTIRDGGPDSHIWIVEEETEVDLEITFEEAGIRHHHRVHHGRCHSIALTVRFNGEKTHSYPPSATIGRILAWAVAADGFNLASDQRPKHALAVPGADHFLSDSVHIGSLVSTDCSVTLDLVPKSRFEG
jgi:hypothetical protein